MAVTIVNTPIVDLLLQFGGNIPEEHILAYRFKSLPRTFVALMCCLDCAPGTFRATNPRCLLIQIPDSTTSRMMLRAEECVPLLRLVLTNIAPVVEEKDFGRKRLLLIERFMELLPLSDCHSQI